MPESANLGKIYHTVDGKTVFVDPKTGQASVFDGIQTKEKVMESKSSLVTKAPSQIMPILQQILPGGIVVCDFISLLSDPESLDAPDEEYKDVVLTDKEYYILVDEKMIPLTIGVEPVPAWVAETKGQNKQYKGFKKHRILPEQWDWLNTSHPKCPIMAWYDENCPAFVALACQEHAKIIRPVSAQDTVKNSSTGLQTLETATVQTGMETVLTEERDV